MAASAETPETPEESTQGFESWVSDVASFYNKLTNKEKNLTLDYLISISGESQLVHLYPLLEDLLYRDFLKLLPPELREYLLAFLDPESLLMSCAVNRTWNQIISSSAGAWQRACETLGLVINRQYRSHDGPYWKSFFIEMAYRQKQMKDGSSFEGQVYDRQLRKVTAVYYHRGKLATASDNKRIQIWDCQNDQCQMTLRTESSVSALKFDDRILIAASYVGHVMSWSLESGARMVEYLRHVGAIFSFDYSDELDVLVSGSADTKIKVWSLMRGNLLTTLQGHNVWVLKVMLKPLPLERDNDYLQKHLLFSMDKTGIIVWAMSFGMVRGAPEGLYISSLYNIPFKNSDMDIGFFTPGLHFDGTHLYFVNQDAPMAHKPALLCKWNVKEKKMDSEIQLNVKVKLFLGVGCKYIAFITPHRHKPNFVVLDAKSMKEVAHWYLPPSRPATPDCSQISIGDKDWLDGLDGENDKGLILAAGLEDKTVYLLKWVPRI